MSSELYKKNIIEHYKNPRNFHKLKSFNRHAEASNVTCGDELQIYLKVEDDIIVEVSFQGSGCAISLASMSMLSEKVKGMKVKDAMNIDDDEVLKMLGMSDNTPRVKCAVLSRQVLQKAL